MIVSTAESLWNKLKQTAARKPCMIVLPEGEDLRIMKASEQLAAQHLAYPILLGDPQIIQDKARNEHISLKDISIIQPSTNPDRHAFIELLMEIRKSKGITMKQAEHLVDDILIHGCLMVKAHKADGFVGGASRTTADTVRAGITIVGVDPSIGTVSGSFIIKVPQSSYGNNGWFVYADCAVVPHPNEQQLADIAIAAAQTYEMFIEDEPRVALLSFSTKGSGRDHTVQCIQKAVEMVKIRAPRINIDGELQLDSALDEAVAKRKMKGQFSSVAGKANVLIFPDLNAGNIAYKLTQRLARAETIGPVLQGLNGAVNDLSRGCSVDDIIKNVLITSVQKQRYN
ncbi:MAG: phosphate acetyltransferase [bacterium]